MLSKSKKSTTEDAAPVMFVTDKTGNKMKKSKKSKPKKSDATEDLPSISPKNGMEGKKKRKIEDVNSLSSPKKAGGKGKNKKAKYVPQQPKDDDSSDISLSDDSNEEFAIDDSDNDASDAEEELEAPVTKKQKKEKVSKKEEAVFKDPMDSAKAQLTVLTDEETKAETLDRINKRDQRTLFIKGKVEKMSHQELLKLSPGACDVRTKKNGVAYIEYKSEKKAVKAFAQLKTLEIGGEPLKVDFTGDKSQHKSPVNEIRLVGEMKIRPHVLYVGGLPSTATESELMQVFQGAEQVRLPRKKVAEISCYAYVIFKTVELAMKAFKEAKDLVINKKPVTVLFAKGTIKQQRQEARQQQEKEEGAGQKSTKKRRSRKSKKNKKPKKDDSE